MRALSVTLLLSSHLLLSASAFANIDLDELRQAVRARDLPRLAQISDANQGKPLEMYPNYYWLTLQLKQISADDANQFLNRYANTPLANRFRDDWIKELARRQAWSSFEQEYAKIDSPSAELQCFKSQAAQARNDNSTLKANKALWFTAKPLAASCNPIFDTLFANGSLSENDAWWRIRQALAANRADFARQLSSRVGSPSEFSAKNLAAINSAPDKQIKQLNAAGRANLELQLYALELIGRKSPEQAALIIEQLSPNLSAADQRFAWQQLGLSAARRHHPNASFWLSKADMNDLEEEDQAWFIRSALRAEDWNAVESRIKALPAETQAKNTYRYWLARAYETQNKANAANEIYLQLADGFDYYGLLAQEKLGTMLQESRAPYTSKPEEINAIAALPGVVRALSLNQQNWRVEANREWNFAMQGLSDTQLLAAAELARKNKMYDRSIYTAERTQKIHDFTLRYPMPYREEAEQAAKEQGLDPAWVYGLIRQESRFISDIRSSAGAAGLMQLMPNTAKWVAGKMKISDFSSADITDVTSNLQMGTYYLAYWAENFNGNAILATAGYNAGPGNARKWRADRELDPTIYIETIPFGETRDYVKKVLSNASHYAHYFKGSPTQLSHRLEKVPAAQ
ncbi:lytic transglycosylase domain-containing protein [Deefgea sp. CFH1-16]|uniref:lytic transglycosylase domain-containing protein n=1 Tax=Deefgea sp. CFH1-16 TaxID=2675457 RepID=UPI0015F42917|nr:lytic transglycosylase domain-containing protein [Deefgea sp. CFH1-16]MBM5574656.1 transglycosylase SLT domain-containing protein [Deefgea sp. CFH1-16]